MQKPSESVFQTAFYVTNPTVVSDGRQLSGRVTKEKTEWLRYHTAYSLVEPLWVTKEKTEWLRYRSVCDVLYKHFGREPISSSSSL